MNNKVLYEDNHIIAIEKKCGDIVQGDKTGDTPLSEKLKQYLKKKYNKQGNVFVGVTHRIDRPVSGIVIFAKTSKALARLNKMFKENKIDKYYYAICSNAPENKNGKLENYLARNRKLNKSYVSPLTNPEAKKAVLEYELVSQSKSFHLLKVKLLSGRHHQIRVQLSNISCPIKGDLKYKDKRSMPNGGICLHAYMIKFIHPVKKEEICIKAPLPNYEPWTFFKT